MSCVSLLGAGVIALASLPVACGKGGAKPAAALPAAAVEVPAAPAGTSGDAPGEPLPARRLPPTGDSEQPEVEVLTEGGSVHFSSRPDAGVRFWGTFTSRDGGFSFKGRFSAGTSVGGSADGGASP